MRTALFTRGAAVLAAVAAGVLVLAAPASAHVTVNPKEAAQGGYTKIAFRVPNEKDDASTVKLEVTFPADTPIASVSLKPVAGWTAQADRAKLAQPVKTHNGELTEAVSKVTWTAAADAVIKPGTFQEFEVSLGPLPQVDQIVFKALQTYSDGDVVRWIDTPTDGAEPEHPAPVLKLTKAAAGGAAATPTTAALLAETKADGDGGSGAGTGFGIAGSALGLVALVIALLAYRRSGASTGARS
ncbi:YcnI family protein [Rhizomonospora bruguierae]|uniref:YcnI family protein n=1 Tax=Rhizomonospora bruguierae TaxID=1581705 RepID=UPI001BD10D86|nr:YcnI family protein [Micromonospora sp. NBRC 107566]